MITKEINVEGIPYNRYEVQVLLADGSVRGELLNLDADGVEDIERQKSVVFIEPWPFELTEADIEELNPAPEAFPE